VPSYSLCALCRQQTEGIASRHPGTRRVGTHSCSLFTRLDNNVVSTRTVGGQKPRCPLMGQFCRSLRPALGRPRFAKDGFNNPIRRAGCGENKTASPGRPDRSKSIECFLPPVTGRGLNSAFSGPPQEYRERQGRVVSSRLVVLYISRCCSSGFARKLPVQGRRITTPWRWPVR